MGIVVFLVGVSITSTTSSFSIKNSKLINKEIIKESSVVGTTIYVDDDNTDGPWDGTRSHPYQFIKDGIKNATQGDTVFVFNGFYRENRLTVDKTIHLWGQSKEHTIIDGHGGSPVVNLSADGVTLNGFKIQGSGWVRVLLVESNNNLINGNNIVNNEGNGISLSGSSNTISDNLIENNEHHGICFKKSSSYNLIENNIIRENDMGILGGIRENTIARNYIANNRNEGIRMGSISKNSLITENEITENGGNGGIYITSASNCIISKNYISCHQIYGFDIYSISDCVFFKNHVINNGYGFDILDSTGNIITENIIANNINDGITLRVGSDNNIISNNTIMCNGNVGINIPYYHPKNNKIFHNDFIENKLNALSYSEFANYWDDGYPSGGNYWDDYTGEDNDGDGIGDIPYEIPGCENPDRYPLMKPSFNLPPDKPTIKGPKSGKPGIWYDYTFVSDDINGDDVYYFIEWGDGEVEEWLGPFSSGDEVIVNHSWRKWRRYTIRAKAKDTNDLEGEWVYLKVTIPRTRVWMRFIDTFQILQRLLFYIK